jgi:hypothetical protein
VVVPVGLTLIVPLADSDADAYVPGVIAMLVAPDVVQLSTLTPPGAMLVGLAVNEIIKGPFAAIAVTVTVAVAVAEPSPLVAVNVYVVVADGLTEVEPIPEVD